MNFYKKDYEYLKSIFPKSKEEKVVNKFTELALYVYAVNSEKLDCGDVSKYDNNVLNYFDMRTCYVRYFTDKITIDDIAPEIESYLKLHSEFYPEFDGDLKSVDSGKLVAIRKYILTKSLLKIQQERIIPDLKSRYKVIYEK